MLGGLIDRRLVRYFDWPLFAFAVVIPLLSLLVLYSAGYDADSEFNAGFLPFAIRSQAFVRQMIFLAIGLIGLFAAMSIPPQWLYRYAYIFYAVCIVLLIAVLLFGLIRNGSRRWIPLGGGFNLQPSELMKVGIVLCLARYLSKNPPKDGSYTFTQLLVPGLIVLVPAILIVDQPDLGSALAVAGVGTLMILFMGVRVKLLVIAVCIAAVLAPVGWNNLHPYQQRRVMTLINPDADPRGSGYHIMQSIIAVGSGEVTGKGFMRGTQTQLEFLPEHTTDFIFSVLAEEWGFVGCLTLLLLYAGLIYRLLRVTGRSKDLFSGLISLGVASIFCIHATVNMGMVIGILPVVGIPLPLFSHGGSAVLTLMVCIGLVLGGSTRRLARIFNETN